MMLKLDDLTTAEIEKMHLKCGFTEDEKKCFELRRKNKSLIQISDEMKISPSRVSILIRKIKKTLPFC